MIPINWKKIRQTPEILEWKESINVAPVIVLVIFLGCLSVVMTLLSGLSPDRRAFFGISCGLMMLICLVMLVGVLAPFGRARLLIDRRYRRVTYRPVGFRARALMFLL